jgi:hypothetical protein
VTVRLALPRLLAVAGCVLLTLALCLQIVQALLLKERAFPLVLPRALVDYNHRPWGNCC